jgi:ribosome-binding protein aMBF1 (putative translation factor)
MNEYTQMISLPDSDEDKYILNGFQYIVNAITQRDLAIENLSKELAEANLTIDKLKRDNYVDLGNAEMPADCP